MTIYDPRATRYDVTRAIPRAALGNIARGMLDAIPAQINGSAPAILDLGCGNGRFLAPMHRLGEDGDERAAPRARLTGIDISESMLAAARSRCKTALLRGTAEHLPFRSAAFDGVVTVSMLHLLGAGLPGVLDEVCRVLRPGGVLVYGRTLHSGPHAGLYESLRFTLPRHLAGPGRRPPAGDFDRLPALLAKRLDPVDERDLPAWTVEVVVGEIIESLARGEWSESFGWRVEERRRWFALSSRWLQVHDLDTNSILRFERVFQLQRYTADN